MKLSKGIILQFDQLIDHNNPSLGTFKQRYYIDNSTFILGSNSPLYLTIGPEGPFDALIPILQSPPVSTWQQDNNALSVMLEHRYYGLSFPVNNYSANSLKYLTVDQALTDLKFFAEYLISNYSINGVKLAFGCSYPGALAAFSKIKYGSFWDGVIAGSGVVNPMATGYPSYFSWYQQSFSKYSAQCLFNMQKAGEYIVELLGTISGRGYISEMFNLCPVLPDINYQDAVQQFYFYIMGGLEVQSDAAFYGHPIQQFCDQLNDTNMNVNDTLKIWSKTIGDDTTCYNTTASIGEFTVDELKRVSIPTRLDGDDDSKSWAYQCCTQLGFFLTINCGQSILGKNGCLTWDYLRNTCNQNGIGIENWKGVDVKSITNEFYGNSIDEYVDNTFFSMGKYDPWRFAETDWVNPNGDNVVLYEHDGTHCEVFYPESSDDSKDIIIEREIIGNWLAQFNKKSSV